MHIVAGIFYSVCAAVNRMFVFISRRVVFGVWGWSRLNNRCLGFVLLFMGRWRRTVIRDGIKPPHCIYGTWSRRSSRLTLEPNTRRERQFCDTLDVEHSNIEHKACRVVTSGLVGVGDDLQQAMCLKSVRKTPTDTRRHLWTTSKRKWCAGMAKTFDFLLPFRCQRKADLCQKV